MALEGSSTHHYPTPNTNARMVTQRPHLVNAVFKHVNKNKTSLSVLTAKQYDKEPFEMELAIIFSGVRD